MQALILAGGQGVRLRPYTYILPKPLMPVGNFPILEIILRQLKRSGVEEVILAVGYMGQLLEAFFQDGSRYGLRLRYSFEDSPLGTAGPIALVMDQLEDDFLVMNGDLLTTFDFRRIFAFHREMKAAATIGLYRREVKIDFGVIETDENKKLTKYVEKPTYSFAVSMGINVLNKNSVMELLRPGSYLDIPELMVQLSNNGLPVYCYEDECLWLDIGRIDDYRSATDIFEAKQDEFMAEYV